jgi:nicotinate-nucleotide pyrophosphorylase (carboxylating)
VIQTQNLRMVLNSSNPFVYYAMNKKELENLHSIIHRALEEDIGSGDITTLSTVPKKSVLEGMFIAKESGVIAGLEVVRETFQYLDKQVSFAQKVTDGQQVSKGTILATAHGKGRVLLTAERTVLNFLQRMSGISTTTRAYVDAVKGTDTVILDTRKTSPGNRFLDKQAVLLGGGANHRFGLFDMVLIKENHIAAAGGITQAVTQVWATDTMKRLIEVEVKNLKELREALSLKVDRILLDNMDIKTLREAVRFTAGRVPLEASGNVTLKNVAAVATTGVDMISVGALTHSVRAMDISFLIQSPKK